jgi:hypothetical protein
MSEKVHHLPLYSEKDPHKKHKDPNLPIRYNFEILILHEEFFFRTSSVTYLAQ